MKKIQYNFSLIFMLASIVMFAACKEQEKIIIQPYTPPVVTPPEEPPAPPVVPTDKDKFKEHLSALNTAGKKVVWVGDSIVEQGKSGIGNSVGFTTLVQNLYPAITFINEGVGGNTSKDIVNRINSITSHNADLYVLAVGINDIRYNDSRGHTNLDDYLSSINFIVNELKRNGAQVALISIWPTFWKDQFSGLLRAATDAKIIEWNHALKLFCKENNLLFLDAHTNIRNYIDFYNVVSLIPDGVHPNYSNNNGKQLYADALLNDQHPSTIYTAEYIPYGNYFYKIVIYDNANPDKLFGIKKIDAASPILDIFGHTANPAYQAILPALSAYNPAFIGFYNKSNDFPVTITLSSVLPLNELTITGMIKSGTNVNRGIKSYDLFYSTTAEALTRPEHKSWKLIRKETSSAAISLNLIPTQRKGVFYILKMNDSNTAPNVSLKRIGAPIPIRIWTQNITSSSAQYLRGIFGSGVSSSSLALVGSTPSYVIAWEAEEDLKTIELESYSGSLKNWTIMRSYSSAAINNPSHSTWTTVATGNGDGTAIILSPPY